MLFRGKDVRPDQARTGSRHGVRGVTVAESHQATIGKHLHDRERRGGCHLSRIPRELQWSRRRHVAQVVRLDPGNLHGNLS
ncbi:MAG: hypothetical protein EB107_03295 [Proteobacteria bacterium]|nr:hypothetical protein [Chloroflexota bacterium]NDF94846.1 hypothetical protein [Pseudomonadota bacterium]